ncbi:MAG: DNA mismatch repair protein MutS [Candidatus Marinimicrobia bacterium]|nr:DNA mismatch repair protein MutS [Candidatus Neomarinimicrobiota bacterium]MBL7023260.1 DNA mismatch repair protein MutS [Candidatus Neomarinimicrobiota bacterium]MBL7108854.1 DNA mismatch repair protein MutS [Candidatus Neomarinimicrobiota bacterium]
MTRSKGATPVMKQFWDAKKAHPDTLMLFRLGDFYETFEKDAKIASEVLGITLTKRANGAASSVPLAGFPYHALDQYLHKLLKAGHRVAICEQVEDPKLAKGIVKREVVEVLSPGTALSEKYLDKRENNYLASIVFEKDKFGISLLDHSTGEFQTGESNTSHIVNMLKQFQVSEIIISESQKHLLQNIIGNNQFFITTCQDWTAEYSTTYEILTEHFATQNLKGFGLEDLNLAISASGMALHYINHNFNGKTTHITSVSVIQEDGIMSLDTFTVRNLELFKSLATQGIHGTLISVIDKTVTSSGSRLLKQWLRRPLTDKTEIEKRLERVQTFVNDHHLCKEIKQTLKEVSDIERILVRLSTQKATPRDVVQLGISLSKIPVFQQVFGKNEQCIVNLLKQAENTDVVVKTIQNTLSDEPPVNTAKGGYIREGFSKELDEYRELSQNATDWLIKYQAEEQQKTSIPSLKVGYNRVFGYYIEVTKTHQNKVPENYIRKQTLTNAERYFTPELKEYENKILSAEEKIISLEAKYFQQLRDDVLKFAKPIQQNAEILAKLDIASALGEIALQNEYIRPKINDDTELLLKESRHPVVEKLLPIGDSFIPNDLELENENKQIAILTGPNMAGKSTYLRQIGLVVIMAQIGCFVPAQTVKIGIVDKLFTRVGASDNLAGGESTFLVEMNETANILNNATPKSLILLDEIGRGTSTYDGLAIAWAVTEYLHNFSDVSAKTVFATHYHELVELADELPRAFNLNVAVKEYGNRVIFLRKIIDGGADKSYGVHVAEMAGLPKSVIQRSSEILNQLMSTENSKPSASLEVKNISQIGLFEEEENKLKQELEELDVNQLTPLEALTELDKLKKKHGLS